MLKISILFVLISLLSCSTSKQNIHYQDAEQISIAKSNGLEDIMASDYIDSIAYVFLETTEECYVAEVTSIFYLNDTIIVFDRKLNSISTFANNGKFIKKIVSNNDIGKGVILNVSQSGKEILVTCNGISDILAFDLTGKRIHQIPSSPYKFNNGLIEPGFYCDFFPSISLRFNNNNYFSIRDSNGTIINQFIFKRKMEDVNKKAYHAFFFNLSKELHFFSTELGSIFIIKKDAIYPSYEFIDSLTGKTSILPTGRFEIDRVAETQENLFIDAIIGKQLFNFIFQKLGKKLLPIKRVKNSRSFIYGITNNIDGIYPVWPVFALNENLYARAVMAKEVNDFHFNEGNLDGQNIFSINMTILEQFRIRKPIENPVIILYKFKNHE